jgi:aldehyde dehydrogenase (NAD+)
LNVVPGRGNEIGDHMTSHEIPSVVSFTGSSAVGRKVARNAAEQLHLPQLELGGNNAHIVTDQADLELAVDAAMLGTFINQGQSCLSINRHLVHESLYDEYADRLAERAADLVIGDPRDPEVTIGPIINDEQFTKITDFIEQTVEAGATIETGGQYENPYVEPTVLTDVTNEMPASCNEHFGPIAPIIPFETDEEAIQLANATDYGLAASVHSEDLGHARDIADQIDVGMVHINDQPANDEPHMPFGGTKQSGLGRFNDRWVLDEYTEPKWISVQREDRQYPL